MGKDLKNLRVTTSESKLPIRFPKYFQEIDDAPHRYSPPGNFLGEPQCLDGEPGVLPPLCHLRKRYRPLVRTVKAADELHSILLNRDSRHDPLSMPVAVDFGRKGEVPGGNRERPQNIVSGRDGRLAEYRSVVPVMNDAVSRRIMKLGSFGSSDSEFADFSAGVSAAKLRKSKGTELETVHFQCRPDCRFT